MTTIHYIRDNWVDDWMNMLGLEIGTSTYDEWHIHYDFPGAR